MRRQQLRGVVAVIMILLIVSLPVIHAAEIRLTYDANGNLVTGDGKYRTYNSLNQLWKVYNGTSVSDPLLEQYTYDPLEERISTKRTYYTNGTLRETVFYVNENFVRVTNSSGSFDFTYVYHQGQLIAQSVNGTKLFIHGNHEGSSSVITNSSGNVVENTTFSPFGEVLSGGTKTRFNYEGKEQDSLVGDTDFNFRKYRPDLGIFAQPDDVITNIYQPQNLNRYSFELNSPYKYVDPTGHCVLPYCADDAVYWAFTTFNEFVVPYGPQIAFNQLTRSLGPNALHWIDNELSDHGPFIIPPQRPPPGTLTNQNIDTIATRPRPLPVSETVLNRILSVDTNPANANQQSSVLVRGPDGGKTIYRRGGGGESSGKVSEGIETLNNGRTVHITIKYKDSSPAVSASGNRGTIGQTGGTPRNG